VRNEQASVIPEPVRSFGLLHLSIAFWRALASIFKIKVLSGEGKIDRTLYPIRFGSHRARNTRSGHCINRLN